MKFSSHPKSAFTLIELLSSIGVIAVLASLLVPLLGKMQANARSAKCMNNLKQWGVVTMAYVADHDGRLPSNESGIWYSALWSYAYPDKGDSVPQLSSAAGTFPSAWKNTIYECPETFRTDPKTSAYRSYGFNLRAGDLDTDSPDKLSTILRPATTALIGDNKASNDLGRTTIFARHNGKCNVVYMDGHVGSIELTSKITEINYFDSFWGVTKYADRW